MDPKQSYHEWGLSGWAEYGSRPEAHEWECIKCGIMVADGDEADSDYCCCEHQDYCVASTSFQGEEIRIEIHCENCDRIGRIQYNPKMDCDVEPEWEG